MNFQYSGKRVFARPTHTFYILTCLALLANLESGYVSKMVYNKDKDLVFVYRPKGLWGDREFVYETHHLEQMVPAPVTAIKDMSSNHENGVLKV